MVSQEEVVVVVEVIEVARAARAQFLHEHDVA